MIVFFPHLVLRNVRKVDDEISSKVRIVNTKWEHEEEG